jgi:hypothetical protein
VHLDPAKEKFNFPPLRKVHGQELFPAGKFFGVAMAAAAGYAFLKLFMGQMLESVARIWCDRSSCRIFTVACVLYKNSCPLRMDFKSFPDNIPSIHQQIIALCVVAETSPDSRDLME